MLIQVAGYQGEASVHTRALRVLAKGLARAWPRARVEVEADVTLRGHSGRSLFDSVERGERTVCYMASGYLASRVPELALLDMPFAVDERTVALQALDGDVGQALASAVAAATGFHVLAFWDNGLRHISNRVRPIRGPDDCRGLRIRTLDSPAYVATLEGLGFTPVVTDVRELRGAVASGQVDAQENPLTNFQLFELWHHHRFLSLTGHLFGIALLLCNRSWLKALDDIERKTLDDWVARATARQRELARDEDERVLIDLRATTVDILPVESIDRQAMRSSVSRLWQEFGGRQAALFAAYRGDGAR